jgi:hypothetical protein
MVPGAGFGEGFREPIAHPIRLVMLTAREKTAKSLADPQIAAPRPTAPAAVISARY